jgi:transposase
MTQIATVVGIDVSKAKLDWCIRGVARATSENSPAGCAALAAELKRHGVGRAVMEASGGYERTIAAALRKRGIDVLIVDPKRVRDFAKAAGRRAKNDAIDADTIAWFGATFAADSVGERSPDREKLAVLVGERLGFVTMRQQCLNRGEHKRSSLCERLRKQVVESIDRAVAKLDEAIAAEIAASPQLAEDAQLLTSTPGIGVQTAAGVLAWLPELGRINRHGVAALVGVAPYDDDSGERRGVRYIKGGRRDLRNLLYMAVLGAATQHNPVLKDYYRSLRARGKLAKVALVACMRKLLTILNVMLARRQAWNPRLGQAQAAA